MSLHTQRPDKGIFIQIDGIDGSGKSTLLNAAKSWAEQNGRKIFDAVEWSKREHRLPTPEDLGDADILLSAEPSHAWIGAAVRNEIIQQGRPYQADMAAAGFALDRGVQYLRLILPFLTAKPGRLVIQDRGLLSSLAYQPLQSRMTDKPESATLTVEDLLELPGNRIALDNPPDFFVFLDIDPKIAQERLTKRAEKTDNHVYETAEFQADLAARYRDEEVTGPLTEKGMQIRLIDGGKTKEEVAREMTAILSALPRV